jgi:hypothetical protein
VRLFGLCSDQNQIGPANNIMCERLFQITLVLKLAII